MVLQCPHCGVKAAPAAESCSACGRRMVRSCPACAERVAVNARACKYCGEELSALREKARARKSEPVRFLEEPVRDPGCAWEDGSKGLLRRWWGTWAQASFSPKGFFRGLSPYKGFSWPLGFAFGLVAQVLVVIVLGLIAGVGVLEFYGVDFKPLARDMTNAGVPTSSGDLETAVRWSPAAVAAIGLPLAFVGVTFALFASALLWHLLLKLLGGKGGFQATVRVIGYGSAAAAWLVIPFAGAVMAPLMKMSLYYHGFREMHGLSRGRALFAVLLPVLIALSLIAWAVYANGCCPSVSPDVKFDGSTF